MEGNLTGPGERFRVTRRTLLLPILLSIALAGCSGGSHHYKHEVVVLPASLQAIFKGCAWRGDIPEIRILVNNGGTTMWRPVVRGRFSRDPADTQSDLFMRQVRVYPGEKRLVVLRGDPQPRVPSKTKRPACEMAGPPQHHY